jgi:xylulokinase
MIGGGAESDFWMGTFSEIWQRCVVLPQYLSEATSLGAALAGGIGVGIYKDFDEIARMNPPRRMLFPHMERAEMYDKCMPAFNSAYDGLREAYSTLSNLRRGR